MKYLKNYYIIIIFLLLLTGIILIGRSIINYSREWAKNQETYQANIDSLEQRYKFYTPDINDNFILALEKYQNDILDTEPIFLIAWLREDSPDNFSITIKVFDENTDLHGIILKEESLDPNGTINTIEEKYPIYIHDPFNDDAISGYNIPVSIRTNNQRKDEKSWEDYLSKDLSYLRKQAHDYDYSDHIDFGIHYVDILDKWKESLPTIWISNTELDNITIWIQAYDKAGNKSNPVKIINKISRVSE